LVREYTLLSANDLEMLKYQKPDSASLWLTIKHKIIIEMMCGIWIISCGLNLYQTFDYLTLQETLQNN
jgi:hypothetical protein